MKKNKITLFALLLLFSATAFVGCGSDSAPSSEPVPPRPASEPTTTTSDPVPATMAPGNTLSPNDALPAPIQAPDTDASQTAAPSQNTQAPAAPGTSSSSTPPKTAAPAQAPASVTPAASPSAAPPKPEAPVQAPDPQTAPDAAPVPTVQPAPESQTGLRDSHYVSTNLQGYLGRIEINGVLLGVRISVTGSYTISEAALQMYRVGAPDQDIVIGIYTHDSGKNQPGARIGPWSKSVNNSNFAAFPGDKVTFTGLNAGVKPGIYWIVAYPASGSGDNHFNYSAIAGTNQSSYFGDEHLQPRDTDWGEKMYAQMNYWLYGR